MTRWFSAQRLAHGGSAEEVEKRLNEPALMRAMSDRTLSQVHRYSPMTYNSSTLHLQHLVKKMFPAKSTKQMRSLQIMDKDAVAKEKKLMTKSASHKALTTMKGFVGKMVTKLKSEKESAAGAKALLKRITLEGLGASPSSSAPGSPRGRAAQP